MPRALVVALLFIAGCHHSHQATPDLAEMPDGATPPDMLVGPDAAMPPGIDGGFPADVTLGSLMPVVDNQTPAGGVVATPTVVAATYDDDTYRTDAEAFYPQYAASAAWAAQTSEYGIGPLIVGTPVHLGPAPATVSDAGLQALMKTNLSGTAPAWGPANTSTLYQFFIPAKVKFDDGTGDACCNDYGGYHGDTVIDGVDVSYSILCECPPAFQGDDPLADLTISAGHELLESVTDPYTGTPGFEWPSDKYFGWYLVTTGELGDMCEYADTANWKPADMTYSIQRTWSNKAALAGHDPCVGDGTMPYYQTIPYMAATLKADIPQVGTLDDILGIRIAVGATASIELEAFADAATGPLTVKLTDVSSAYYGGDVLLTFSPESLTMMPGEHTLVQVTVAKADPANLGSIQPFVVTTKSATGPSTAFYATIGQ